MKKIKETIKKVLKAIAIPFVFVGNEVAGVYGLINFWNKRREAMRNWKGTGRRNFVIPTQEGKIVVVDNVYIKVYNKNQAKNKHISHHDLLKLAYFMTPVGTIGGGEKRKLSLKNPK